MKVLAPILIFAFWLIMIFTASHNLRVFTTFSKALYEAGPIPRKIPEFFLTDQNGKNRKISEFRGKYILVNFMYTRCKSVCHIVNSKLIHVKDRIIDLMPEKIQIVSISFDQAEEPDRLDMSWRHHGSAPGWWWTELSEQDSKSNAEKLRAMGIWVGQRPNGEYDHTAFIFLVNPMGDVIKIFRPEMDSDLLADAVLEEIK